MRDPDFYAHSEEELARKAVEMAARFSTAKERWAQLQALPRRRRVALAVAGLAVGLGLVLEATGMSDPDAGADPEQGK